MWEDVERNRTLADRHGWRQIADTKLLESCLLHFATIGFAPSLNIQKDESTHERKQRRTQ